MEWWVRQLDWWVFVTRPAFPPMPTVISTVDEAESAFGIGSQMARMARLAILGPVVRHCSCGRTINGTYAGQCGDCYRRDKTFEALELAFAWVGQCIAIVEGEASCLFVSDLTDSRTLTEWRAVAFEWIAERPSMWPGLDDGGEW